VFKRSDSLAAIADGLALIKLSCEQRGWLKLFDNNVVAQHFFCRFLNTAFGLRLVEMDQTQANYPAIDLGDPTNRVAYQVTTERRSDKVQHTLDKFVAHGLEKQYDTLRILIIGDRQATYKPVFVPAQLPFDCDRDIIGIEELVRHLGTLDSDRLEMLQVILAEEVKPPAGGLAGLTVDVGVERDPPNDGRCAEVYPPDRILRYFFAKETIRGEEWTIIAPDVGYLALLESGSQVEAVKFFHSPFRCHFPNLDVTFVNNSGETLVVTEAAFEVSESVPEVAPVIVFKDNNARMKLFITNEG